MKQIFCDRCKEELRGWIAQQEMYTIAFRGGYGSIFGDGNRVSIDLCQECLHEILLKENLVPKYDEGLMPVEELTSTITAGSHD